ncbi:hypothetical protein [Flagellimonas baculiformis]|uniref:hypothetical protein n=1 Tax=Flagellimonas baculiformis TaxID=3067310 RepID=UPI00296F8673|nr:hypothetical protein [Muricauda sp. D6]
MHNKTLVIRLIQQDLKHSQLTEQLRQMGLDDGGLYSLDLMTIVAEFMEVPPKKMERFAEIYGCYLDEATAYPISYLGGHLLPVAERCHEKLSQSLKDC